jgi:iron complex outermembrane recepter protein
MKPAVYIFALLLPHLAFNQSLTDSTQQLEPVLIQAYSTGRTLDQVPASVAYIGKQDFSRFSNTSILPALNAIPGVRMEERSPGSYRFSIRGSLLRSPFGVRNVKVYWNGIPFTDGGGNTYLNLLDFASIGSAEVIKGPGGSLYGAGTGGVLLLSSGVVQKNQIDFHALAGSYGLQRYGIAAQLHREKINGRIQFFHQGSSGYREQTAMSRDAIHADINFLVNSSSTLSLTFLYTDLFYETPGGLTAEQFEQNPKQARPAAGFNRGAVEQRAAITNQTPFLGLKFDKDWNEQWSTRIAVTASHSEFANPAIRNYETRSENNLGARMETEFTFGAKKTNKIIFGGEYQYFGSSIHVYGNTFGLRDTVQTSDDLNAQTALLFGQAEYHLPQNFFLTIGGSINYMNVVFERSYPTVVKGNRDLDPSFAPRIALLNRITPALTIFASMSRGFSPPGIAELYPSNQVFNRNIQAERGVNLEVGVRGVKVKRQLDFDVTVYQFKLKDALVIRRQPDDAEYFVNAGETLQRGIEAMLSWNPIRQKRTVVSDLKIWNNYNYNQYRFENYSVADANFSGNKLTGVPPVVNTSGLDLEFKKKIYLNVTGSYVDHVPLDDGNTSFANEYFLLGARLGWRQPIQKHSLHVFTGIDNTLDKTYSLGNDLNAIASRFYNIAPARNYYLGLQFSVNR